MEHFTSCILWGGRTSQNFELAARQGDGPHGALKHFEQVSSPVPGLLVIDQISRPYYPKDEKAEDERDLSEMKDDDQRAMKQIIDFIFAETARAAGLQVLLIEHAYMATDARYVDATVERWTKENGRKLIPDDWPERGE